MEELRLLVEAVVTPVMAELLAVHPLAVMPTLVMVVIQVMVELVQVAVEPMVLPVPVLVVVEVLVSLVVELLCPVLRTWHAQVLLLVQVLRLVLQVLLI